MDGNITSQSGKGKLSYQLLRAGLVILGVFLIPIRPETRIPG